MGQKTTWMHFLISGISIYSLLCFCGCDNNSVDEIQRAEYVYINNSGGVVRLELYNSNSSYEIDLPNNDSITFLNSGNPVAFPFTETEIEGRVGDSVVLRYGGNKCTYYKRNSDSGTFGGDGVFNLQEYENYTQKLIGEKHYRLVYKINDKDFNRIVDCK
jgi:hypothetical protein